MTKLIVVNKIFHFLILISVIVAIFSISLFLTHHVTNDSGAQLLVQQFGYFGVLLISFIAGLNLIVPVPAATFVPVFTAGGIPLPIIILLLVIGTMSANLLSYFIGKLGHSFTSTHYPKIQKRIFKNYAERKNLLPYFVFAFAAFIPLPDEVYLIPLGIIGVKIREFIIPLVLGTITFQTLTALGVQNIFSIILN